jgi:hypothetical protein
MTRSAHRDPRRLALAALLAGAALLATAALGACVDLGLGDRAWACEDDACAPPPACPGAAGCQDSGTSPRPDACTPACAGRACGPDGCGGTCGTCGRVPLVFQVDMNPGGTRNCVDTEPDRWLELGALEDPTATAWLVGGVHIETPICGAERVAHCLTHAERDALHAALGEWQPNRVAMHDDGTEGDALAGDGVFAVTLEVPYWDPAEAPDEAGVRLGYKYTWGHASDLWTGTEEWPGNQRLLELVDVNGDGRIVRRDRFGDETTNKDRHNRLEPARGGCGVVVFEQERLTTPEFGDCVMDSREAQIDTDGDCALDAWPAWE